MVRRKVIIDTDAGGDDAVAIMAALAHPTWTW
jgi:inosine-uridine nucleoside N-ribohydrolase